MADGGMEPDRHQAGAIGSYTLIGMMLGALIFRRSQINTAAKGVGLLYLSVQPVYCSSRSDRFSAFVYDHAVSRCAWNGRVDAECHFADDRVFAEKTER